MNHNKLIRPIAFIRPWQRPDATIYLYGINWGGEQGLMGVNDELPRWVPMADVFEDGYVGFTIDGMNIKYIDMTRTDRAWRYIEKWFNKIVHCPKDEFICTLHLNNFGRACLECSWQSCLL